MEIILITLIILSVASTITAFRLRLKLKECLLQRDASFERNMSLTKELMYFEEQLTDSQSKVTHLQMVIDSVSLKDKT
jgi:hypothetical protein